MSSLFFLFFFYIGSRSRVYDRGDIYRRQSLPRIYIYMDAGFPPSLSWLPDDAPQTAGHDRDA